MSPTVFRSGKYRFYFNSREEDRMHVHIQSSDGEAKFWLEPIVALENAVGFRTSELRLLQGLVEEHCHAIARSWKEHFKSQR